MRILFLDFDGVLNSWQSNDYRRHRAKNNWLIGARVRLGARLCKILMPFRYHRHVERILTNFLFLRFSDHCDFCPIACSNLQCLLDDFPDLRVVVSSDWRKYGHAFSLKVLNRNGIDASKVVGFTDTEPGIRGWQIKRWVDSHKEILGFVVVDDNSDMDPVRHQFVKVDINEGFMKRFEARVRDKLQECCWCDGKGSSMGVACSRCRYTGKVDLGLVKK